MDEYIKRGLALERINDLRCDRGFDSEAEERGWNNAIDVVLSIVKSAPIADVRPERHGWWEHKQKPGEYPKWYCSHCGRSYICKPRGANYCEECGAVMDGGVE